MAYSKRNRSRAKHGNRKWHFKFDATLMMNQDTKYLSNLLGEVAVPSLCRPKDNDDDGEFEIDIK